MLGWEVPNTSFQGGRFSMGLVCSETSPVATELH